MVLSIRHSGTEDHAAADLLATRATSSASLSWFFPGYRTGALLVCLGMIVSIMLLGLRMPYYNKAASDMVSIYEALVFNSGLPQDFIVYPGVVTRVMLGLWLQLLQVLGLIQTARLQALTPASDIQHYEATWQTLVEAGRVFSLAIGIACVLSFTALVRRWIGVWQIAVLSGTALAFSSGYALGFRIMRPEMMSATLVFCALLLLFLAARDGSRWRFAKLALAGFLVSLAVLEKVQAVIPALALLPLALAFGAHAPNDRSRDKTSDLFFCAGLIALAVLVLWPAVAILGHGIAAMGSSTLTGYTPLTAGLSGKYQYMLAAAIVAVMIGYARIWRVGVLDAIQAMAAVGLGLSCGIDLLYFQPSLAAIVAIANPIEHLQAYSAGSGASLMSQTPGTIAATLVAAIGKGLAIHSFFLSPTHRPTLIIDWLAWAGAVFAYRSGRLVLALQIAILLATAIAEDSIFSLRQVKVYYLPYSDPAIILAGALALSQFESRIMSVQFRKIAVPLMVVYIVWGHAQPALAVYSRHDRGKVCGIVTQFTKRITIPYCADGSGPAMK